MQNGDMQTSTQQAVTWTVVALEAVKIGGPALLTLAGTLIALRHQRRLRDKELDAGARLKARELVFNHYQKKLEKISAMSDSLGKSFAEIQVHLLAPRAPNREAAFREFTTAFLSVVHMAKHEVEDAETHLKTFGLEQKYERELAAIKKFSDKTWPIEGDLQQQMEFLRETLFSLVLIQEALLEARMKELFDEYLPARSVSVIRAQIP
jgi:hypothetical protein